MANKAELTEEAKKLNIEVTGEETNAELEDLIAAATSPTNTQQPPAPKPTQISKPAQEAMVPLSQVKALIAEAMAAVADKDKPVKVKRATEHHAHVWRLGGKWVVDFADRNWNYETNEPIDPYVKDKIHAYQLFNQQKREFEAWIKIIFHDGSTEEIPLNRYVERRTLVYCPIIKREQVDRSYSIGEVEKKKEVGESNVGTGIMIDQEVQMHGEIFHVKAPSGEEFALPDYVIC